MFALIIAIISIALIVATIAATMYHGGDTLTQGRNRAEAAGIISGAQQIAGAQVMRMSLADGQAANVAQLVTENYLSSAPDIGTVSFDQANRVLNTVIASADVCAAINQAAGITAARTASAADTDAQLVVAAADLPNFPYGCDTTFFTFAFKY